MLPVERPLPEEREETLPPDSCDFVLPGEWEQYERVEGLYRRALDLYDGRIPDLCIPSLGPLLQGVESRRRLVAELDRSPAQALFERHDIQYPYACEFGDASLTIDKGVFCPTFTRVSPLLLNAVDFKPGERVLDAFAGSGAFGVNAALHGAKVVSVDISETAVRCIRNNAKNNGVEIDARLGTMKAQIAQDEKFDLIIANPPLLPDASPGQSTEGITAAVFDRGLQATLDFIDRLPDSLAPDGRCYLVTSDIMERCEFGVPKICRRAGLRTTVVSSADLGYEAYSVHKIEHRRIRNLHWLIRS